MRWSISPRDIPVLVEAWWTLWWVDRRIRRRDDGWRALFEAPATSGRGGDGRRLVRLTERVARHHLRPMNCLRRTLAARLILARRGISSSAHIGVRIGDDQVLRAHAWLSDGHGGVLNDAPDVTRRYRELLPDNWIGIGFDDD